MAHVAILRNSILTINGYKFAKNDSDMLNSLFHSDGRTCTGYYKVMAGGILLMNGQKEPVLFIVTRATHAWFVSVCRESTGRLRYAYATCSIDERLVGLDSVPDRDKDAIAWRTVQSVAK